MRGSEARDRWPRLVRAVKLVEHARPSEAARIVAGYVNARDFGTSTWADARAIDRAFRMRLPA